MTTGAARLFSVVSGLTGGVLLAGGAPLTRLWTGDESHFDGDLMLAAAVPMILTPVAVLVHNVLVSHQAPLMPAIARGVQLLVTLAAYAAVAQFSPPIRMMLALSIGEIVGFAPIAYWASARLAPGLGVAFHGLNVALALATAVVGGGLARAALAIVDPVGSPAICATFVAVGLLSIPIVYFAGMDRNGRRRLREIAWGFARRRTFRAEVAER